MRLDVLLVKRGLSRSRDGAARAVREGRVRIDGAVARKPGQKMSGGEQVTLLKTEEAFVSRGALKLVHGLDNFGMDTNDAICLDLGASTGGFTDVLLRRGAARVYAVDVGHGQLHQSLADDPRVVDLEGLHARDVAVPGLIPETIDLLVCDVSFISLTKALPMPSTLCRPGARLCALVKPQFELGPEALGKGGIVRLPPDEAIDRIRAEILPLIAAMGWQLGRLIDSPVRGGDGNREFLLEGTRAA